MDGGHQEYMWQLSGNDGPDLEWEYVPIPGTKPTPPPVKEVILPRIEYMLECSQYEGTPNTRMEEPVYSARYIFFIIYSLVINKIIYQLDNINLCNIFNSNY